MAARPLRGQAGGLAEGNAAAMKKIYAGARQVC
jgi:hypothetical protein